MKSRWRKAIAVPLALLFLFTSFSVTFAHQHYVLIKPGQLKLVDGEQADILTAGQGFAPVCPACIYSMGNHATPISIQDFIPQLSAYALVRITPVLAHRSISFHTSSRAPPLNN